MAPPATLPTTTTLTLAYFYNALRGRLGASFWSDAELRLYVQEAIRTWNAAAAFYRYPINFTTSAPGEAFYDLTQELKGLLTHTLKDADLVTLMEYHLLEPPTPTSWTGSDMFTLADLTAALERRRNQFLGETGIELAYYEPSVTKATSGRVTFQDSLIDVRRLAWRSSAGTYTPLWREDERNLQLFSPGWQSGSSTPQVYSLISTPPFTIQLAPPMDENGKLNVLALAAATPLNPATGIGLGIPDDFAWVVKWGALADLLSKDAQAADPTRAEYCRRRYEDGVQLAKLYSPVITARIGGSPVPIVSVAELDTYKRNWMNDTGAPTVIALAGGNILALDTVPATSYSLDLDLVGKAPVSMWWGLVKMTWEEATGTWGSETRTWEEMLALAEGQLSDDDSLNITNEIADAIIDYAHHVACFKMGGQEFLNTTGAYVRLMQMAAHHNDRLAAAASNFDVLSKQNLVEKRERPRLKTDAMAGVS